MRISKEHKLLINKYWKLITFGSRKYKKSTFGTKNKPRKFIFTLVKVLDNQTKYLTNFNYVSHIDRSTLFIDIFGKSQVASEFAEFKSNVELDKPVYLTY